jgi:hypothetical protein
MMTPEYICEQLKLDLTKVINIYPYGSKVYGTATEHSDDDFVIVFKGSLLPSGAFKDNAISSNDYKIQGVCYSRSGFIDAINNYQVTALECIFLPENRMVKNAMPMSLRKLDLKEMAKKIISTASSSWHFASLAYKSEDIDGSKKNIYHALRIVEFGLQIKEHGKIIDYSASNKIKEFIYEIVDEEFRPNAWQGTFVDMCEQLKPSIIPISK